MEKLLSEKLPGGLFANVSEVRSRTMSKIRGKNAKSTERTLQMALVRNRISGWKRHANDLPGKPDFYFPADRLAVFVDGCFWHGCPRCGHIPKTNGEFWAAKIQRNIDRDSVNQRKLKKAGVRSIRFWEHSLKGSTAIQKVVARIRVAIGRTSTSSTQSG